MTRLVLVGLLQVFLLQASRGDCAPAVAEPQPAPAEPSISWEPFGEPKARGYDGEGITSSLATEALARWNVGGNGDVSYLSNRTGFHPGTRVIVEIETSRQLRAQRELPAMNRRYLAAFRNFGYWPYRTCFEASARVARSAGGEAWIRVRT